MVGFLKSRTAKLQPTTALQSKVLVHSQPIAMSNSTCSTYSIASITTLSPIPSHMPKKLWVARPGAIISVNSMYEVLVSAREHSTRFTICREGCVHIAARYTDACDMLGTKAVRWMHAMFVTGRAAVLRSDRAAAWGLNSPRVRDNQCDPDVPLELLREEGFMDENGNLWPGIQGFITWCFPVA